MSLSVTIPPAPTNCNDVDPDLFFSESPEEIEQAKALCETCYFQAECFMAGVDEDYGIWGGYETANASVLELPVRPDGRFTPAADQGAQRDQITKLAREGKTNDEIYQLVSTSKRTVERWAAKARRCA